MAFVFENTAPRFEFEDSSEERFVFEDQKPSVISNVGKGAMETAKISPAAFYLWRKNNPRLKGLVERAEEISNRRRIGKVKDALYRNALKGNVTAQIFFLKNHCSEEYKDVHEHTGIPENKSITQIIYGDNVSNVYTYKSDLANRAETLAERLRGIKPSGN